jgi:4-amino-4-deoxy-L-arabinose transferase-like glycosyltransferase
LYLGTKWFNFRVGALAAVLYFLNPAMLENAAGGTEAPMLGFLLLALLAVAVAYLSDKNKPIWKAAAFGAVAAVLALTKYAWGLSLIPVLIAVLYSTPTKSRLTATLAAFGAFIVVLLPWMIRNAMVVGDPFFTLQYAEGLMNTKSFPGNTLYRTYTTSYPSVLMFFLTSPKEALEKLRTGLSVVYPILITAPGLYLGALFVGSIFTTLGTRPFELARYVLYGAYVLCVLALLVVFPSPRLLVCLAAPATLFAVAYFDKLLTASTEKMLDKAGSRWSLAAMAILLVVVLLPTALQLSAGRSADATRMESARDTARQVAALVDGPVVSDVPWPLAWYGDVKTIWLPKTVKDLNKVENIIGPAKWLLLTPMVYRSEETERTQDWVRMWGAAQQNDVLSQGYAVYRRLPDNWILVQRVTVDASRGGTAGAAGK